MRSGDFTVTVSGSAQLVVVAPHGELDIATMSQLREELARHDGERPLVLDLRGLTFMDSSGLALVLEQHRRAERDGADFRVVPGAGMVQRLLETTGIERQLTWADPGLIASNGATTSEGGPGAGEAALTPAPDETSPSSQQ